MSESSQRPLLPEEQAILTVYRGMADRYGFTQAAKDQLLNALRGPMDRRAAYEDFATTAGYNDEQRKLFMADLPVQDPKDVFNGIIDQAAARHIAEQENISEAIAITKAKELRENRHVALLEVYAKRQFTIEREQEEQNKE